MGQKVQLDTKSWNLSQKSNVIDMTMYFIYKLKIQYVYKIIILGLKMIVKSRLEKVFLKPS